MIEGLKTSRLVALTVLFVTTAALVLAYVPGTWRATMYSIDDEGPFGLSDMYSILSDRVKTKTVIGSISILLRENVTNAAIFIIGPYKSFSSDEISSIPLLLARGNSIILACDFGSGNQILSVISYILYEIQKAEYSNSTVYVKKFAFNGSVLMDASSFVGSPANPVLTNILHDNDPLGFFDGVDKIATYMPTALSGYVRDNNTGEPKEYWSPLPGQAMSTEFSRLETNLQSVKDGTYRPDSDERGGVPFSVILYYPFMKNQFIMLVGDPDIFTNRYLRDQRFDNRAFVENIANYLASKGAVAYIDQSHEPALPVSSTAYLSIILRTISYFTLFPILGLFVPRSLYNYLKRLMPEYEARGILIRKIKRRTAYEFNPDAKATLEKNDFTEPLKLLLDRFKNKFASRYGSRSRKAFERVAKRRKIPKVYIKTLREALSAIERGRITRDEFVLYARRIIELERLIGVRRYELGRRGKIPAD